MSTLVALVEHSEHPAAWKALVAFALFQLLMGVFAWRLFRPRDESDGGDDGGGPGGPEAEPKRPPPDPVICWPEFERQFAEYVARHTPAE